MNFADGSSRSGLVPLASQRTDGAVKDLCSFGRDTIDVNQVVSVTIGGKTIPFDEARG